MNWLININQLIDFPAVSVGINKVEIWGLALFINTLFTVNDNIGNSKIWPPWFFLNTANTLWSSSWPNSWVSHQPLEVAKCNPCVIPIKIPIIDINLDLLCVNMSQWSPAEIDVRLGAILNRTTVLCFVNKAGHIGHSNLRNEYDHQYFDMIITVWSSSLNLIMRGDVARRSP